MPVTLGVLCCCRCVCTASWFYVCHAYGAMAYETAHQLYVDRGHCPLSGVNDGSATQQALSNSLLRWRMIDWHAHRKTRQWSWIEDERLHIPPDGTPRSDDEIHKARVQGTTDGRLLVASAKGRVDHHGRQSRKRKEPHSEPHSPRQHRDAQQEAHAEPDNSSKLGAAEAACGSKRARW
jgi:hypothetical protein